MRAITTAQVKEGRKPPAPHEHAYLLSIGEGRSDATWRSPEVPYPVFRFT
jgi:hypothetical protein